MIGKIIEIFFRTTSAYIFMLILGRMIGRKLISIKIPKTTKIIKMIIFIRDITDSIYPKCLVPSLFIPITMIKETKANKDDYIVGIQYFKNIPVAIASELMIKFQK